MQSLKIGLKMWIQLRSRKTEFGIKYDLNSGLSFFGCCTLKLNSINLINFNAGVYETVKSEASGFEIQLTWLWLWINGSSVLDTLVWMLKLIVMVEPLCFLNLHKKHLKTCFPFGTTILYPIVSSKLWNHLPRFFYYRSR